MIDNFNQKKFDDITTELSKKIKKEKKSGSMTLTDLENIIDEILNDEEMVKKYNRTDIVKYTKLITDEINRNEFDLSYLKSRFKSISEHHKIHLLVSKEYRKKKKRSLFANINPNFLIKNLSSAAMILSKDLVLLFFTICIVAHLRMRSFISSCYLYPSNPLRFPYAFYNFEKKEQHNVLSIQNFQTDSDIEPVFDNIKIYHDNLEKNKRINKMCGGTDEDEGTDESNNNSLLDAAASILFGEKKEEENSFNGPFPATAKRIIQELNGTTHSEKMERLNGSAKAFMEEHREKCKDELSLYSLVTYIMFYNSFKNNEFIANLHNGFFKGITSSGSKLSFGIMVIFLYSIFKTNINIAEDFVNNILNNYANTYKGGGKMHEIFTGIVSSIFAPFITFSLLLLIIIYPISLFNCLKSYFNYIGLTNQIITKLVCLFGIIYTLGALVAYATMTIAALFPGFMKYIKRQLSGKSKSGSIRKTGKSGGAAAAAAGGGGGGTKKKKKKKKKNKKKKGGGTKKKRKNKKKNKKKKREGFADKRCNQKVGFFDNFNIAKLFGVAFLTIIGIIIFLPVIMPFLCSFMSIFGIAFSLSFESIKYMKDNMCFIKDYSSIIKLLVSMILIHHMMNRYSYGSRRNKWIEISVYLLILIMYIVMEVIYKPTNNYFKELNCDN